MSGEASLRGARLLLRRWRDTDLQPFAAMNADPVVMEYFPSTLAPVESVSLAARIDAGIAARGYGLWAVELPGEAPFIGFVGLEDVDPGLPFAPAVELGWRLAREHWGRGLAREAAVLAARRGGDLGLSPLVSYTAAINLRSRRLMERLGMRRDPAEDFRHPALAAGSRLSHHVLYRLDQAAGPCARPPGRRRGFPHPIDG